MVGMALLVWGVSVAAQQGNYYDDLWLRHEVPRAKVVTLVNRSPWQSWVRLFCKKMQVPACAVRYWPGKTNTDGRAAGLEAALKEAEKTAAEAPRRTPCIARRNDPVEARAYTRLGGELLAVANRAFRLESDPLMASTAGLTALGRYRCQQRRA